MSRTLPLTEAQFTSRIIDRARFRGWRVAHFRPAQTNQGWRTPMQGHPGFPDLVLARNGEVLFVELKSEKGKLTPEQRDWLAHTNGRLWRPADWPDICTLLDA